MGVEWGGFKRRRRKGVDLPNNLPIAGHIVYDFAGWIKRGGLLEHNGRGGADPWAL